jgi:hypothetical protein
LASITSNSARVQVVGATRIVTRVLAQIEGGEVSPKQAAAIINNAVDAIKEAAK